MLLARFVAVVFLIQGLAPALLFGAARPGGIFLLAIALLYAVVARGLWTARRWGLSLAFLLTLAQALIVSTPVLSWQFIVAASYGVGLAVAPQVPIFLARTVGARLDVAIFQPSPRLLASMPGVPANSFVIFNLLALPPLVLLLVLAANQRRGVGSTSSLEPVV